MSVRLRLKSGIKPCEFQTRRVLAGWREHCLKEGTNLHDVRCKTLIQLEIKREMALRTQLYPNYRLFFFPNTLLLPLLYKFNVATSYIRSQFPPENS